MPEQHPHDSLPPNVTVLGSYIQGDKNVYIGADNAFPEADPRGETGRIIIDGSGLIVRDEGFGESSQNMNADRTAGAENGVSQPAPGTGFELVSHQPIDSRDGVNTTGTTVGRTPGGLDIVASPGFGDRLEHPTTIERVSAASRLGRSAISDQAMANLGIGQVTAETQHQPAKSSPQPGFKMKIDTV